MKFKKINEFSLISMYIDAVYIQTDFPGGASGKELVCQCRRHKRCGFDSQVGKIPWRRVQANYCSIVARRSPWTEELGGLQFQVSQKSDMAEMTFSTAHILIHVSIKKVQNNKHQSAKTNSTKTIRIGNRIVNER